MTATGGDDPVRLATALGEFAGALRHDDVPDGVRRAAMWHTADLVGTCVAALAPTEATRDVCRHLAATWATPTRARVLGLDTTCRPESAALINGTLGQALEMDDKHGPSLARPGATVIPAVLAVAEEQQAEVQELVTAIVVGYEVLVRLGFVARDRFLARGYHTSSLLGGFAAAAAVGRLRGCTPEQIVDALGIVGTFASGIQEATRTGATSKILHGGWGAHSGILAVDLAIGGITGPASVFEGPYGFFPAHLSPIDGELDWAAPVHDLGRHWHLPETAYKPYPCCQLLHAFIDAAIQVRADIEADGGTVADIAHISCRLAEPGLALVTEPRDRKWAPEYPHEARFSLPFVVAAAFTDGEVDLDTFAPARLADPRLRALAGKVESGDDPESDYPLHCPAVMDVTANGMTYHRRVAHHPGSPEAPLSEDAVLDKFAANTSWLLGQSARRVGADIAGLPGDAPIHRITTPVAADRAVAGDAR